MRGGVGPYFQRRLARVLTQPAEGEPVPLTQHQVEAGVVPPEAPPLPGGQQQPAHLGVHAAALVPHHEGVHDGGDEGQLTLPPAARGTPQAHGAPLQPRQGRGHSHRPREPPARPRLPGRGADPEAAQPETQSRVGGLLRPPGPLRGGGGWRPAAVGAPGGAAQPSCSPGCSRPAIAPVTRQRSRVRDWPRRPARARHRSAAARCAPLASRPALGPCGGCAPLVACAPAGGLGPAAAPKCQCSCTRSPRLQPRSGGCCTPRARTRSACPVSPPASRG